MLRHICHRRHHAYIGQCWPTWWKSVASTTHKERKCAIRAILKIYIFYTFACVHSFYADVYEKLLNWNAVKYNNHNEKLNEWNIFSLFGERCWCSCHSHTWTLLMYWGRWSKKVPKSPIPNIILPKSPFFQNRINQWSVHCLKNVLDFSNTFFCLTDWTNFVTLRTKVLLTVVKILAPAHTQTLTQNQNFLYFCFKYLLFW